MKNAEMENSRIILLNVNVKMGGDGGGWELKGNMLMKCSLQGYSNS